VFEHICFVGGEAGGVAGSSTCNDFTSSSGNLRGYTAKYEGKTGDTISFKESFCDNNRALACVQTPKVGSSLSHIYHHHLLI
jgi:hypothetical protein